MAVPIVVGVTTYLENFTGGQAGVGPRTGSNYVEYMIDLDTDFETLRTTVNQIIAEVNGIQGPNAGLGIDLLVFNDLERPASGEPNDLVVGVNDTGFVGLHSGEISITTVSVANDSVLVDPGLFIIDGVAVRSAGATKTGSGGSAIRYIAIDLNGAVYIETTPNARNMDLYSINWNGTAFTGSFTRQNQMFFDGDEYEQMRARPAAGTTPVAFALRRYESFHSRMEAVERLLAGFTTDNLGNALGVPSIQSGGTQSLPSLAVNGDVDTGLFGAVGTLSVTAAGATKMTWATAITAAVVILGVAGTAGAPTYSFTAAGTKGMYSTGTNSVGFSTSSTLRADLDAEGNLDLPTNSRVKGIAPTQSITDATATLVDFATADEFDIGAWHDAGSGTLAVRQEFNLPAGAEGLYHILVFYEWASPATITDITIEITIEGVAQPEKVEDRIVASSNRSGVLSLYKVLVTNDTVRVRVTQNDTVGAAALNLEAASLAIIKVA